MSNIEQLKQPLTLVLYMEGNDMHWVGSDGSHGSKNAVTDDGEFCAVTWANVAQEIIEETGAASFEWI